MQVLISHTDRVIRSALRLAEVDEPALHEALDAIPAPVYLTDAGGVITYFNPACVTFAGRQPRLGKDKWCVSWKLHTQAGATLRHEDCPMAVAVRTRTPLRGLFAVAERPDGTRVAFTPMPTPRYDAQGKVVGAINILIDEADARQIADLEGQAVRARRLAAGISDKGTARTLGAFALECDAEALELSAGCVGPVLQVGV